MRILVLIAIVGWGCSSGGPGAAADGAPPADARVWADASCEEIAETCNGLDDNCNLLVDEGFGIGLACDGPDADGCTEGTTTCAGCTDTTGDAVELPCNDIDDDCDGQLDEVAGCTDCCDSGDADACLDDDAACTPFGMSCGDDGVTQYEICGNAADDDCDGAVDETSAEECNSVDDDCNGEIDEGCNCGAVELICNGLDDNCDGYVDEISACTACCDSSGDPDTDPDDNGVCTPFGITCTDA